MMPFERASRGEGHDALSPNPKLARANAPSEGQACEHFIDPLVQKG
jgi:hypothetical protein